MKKRFSSLMRSMALGGLVVTGLAKMLILLTASPVPDPASGRTEPSLFAPKISTNWDYITPLQTWLLIVLMGTTLIAFAAWALTALMQRRADGPPIDRIAGRHGR
ncbi:MAG: hypothetical protein EOS65_13405 [Mesorhizobium sp.]|uniref:hypothetical protein n=1 Tax=Mesorhizobium sp. TaxID=1871066 RepID=UPI000FD23759|nr:hypothetical protein [Mesorhizobium sp.]RVC60767.1 hypothetical protein EN779_12485 [Mesorhizobium sp. M4B.F.Ca.ET.088.02.2.1]RWF32042.1 MAG: hypothetical protein EOS45_08060 [Mesorhizobium sp.]RWF41106.1 MAG: hypothetical protein EOS65_13405 [Mesorhizobium sp.]TIX15850.1 MAG: hypothetical protein E5V41_14875 [Mesorhizobium sp.]TJW04855.1 MAG: hypothetical protein E5W97_11250 [Mesorhizobium sp.]